MRQRISQSAEVVRFPFGSGEEEEEEEEPQCSSSVSRGAFIVFVKAGTSLTHHPFRVKNTDLFTKVIKEN